MKLLCIPVILFLFSCNTVDNKESEAESLNRKGPALKTEVPPGYISLKGSKNTKDLLCQCWENDDDWEEARRYGVAADVDMVLRGYCFYKDGSLIKHPRGYMEQGRWQLDSISNPQILHLHLNSGDDASLSLEMVRPLKLKLRNDQNELQTYTATGLQHADVANDPFHAANNTWRIKPGKAETPAQVSARLKGCIHFFVLFYDQMIATKAATVLFAGYPSCFTWYAGGIFLQKKEELQQKWIDCFYNREQAMEAYALAGKLLQQKYTWPKGEKEWMKLNVAVLKQMEQKIDSIN